jgi:hypothetical protein
MPESGMSKIGTPPVSVSAAPRATESIPSVAMNAASPT